MCGDAEWKKQQETQFEGSERGWDGFYPDSCIFLASENA